MKDFWQQLKRYVKTTEGDGSTFFQIDEKCMIPESIAIEIWKLFKNGEQAFYNLEKEQDYNRLLRQENEMLSLQNEELYDQLNDPSRNTITLDLSGNKEFLS